MCVCSVCVCANVCVCVPGFECAYVDVLLVYVCVCVCVCRGEGACVPLCVGWLYVALCEMGATGD